MRMGTRVPYLGYGMGSWEYQLPTLNIRQDRSPTSTVRQSLKEPREGCEKSQKPRGYRRHGPKEMILLKGVLREQETLKKEIRVMSYV
jgi:hypothetical protein